MFSEKVIQEIKKKKKRMLIIKRIFDVLFSILGLIVLSPLFLVIGMLIKIDSCGPVFFRQTRVGLKGKEFQIIKFRTMIYNREDQGLFLTMGDDPRVTRLGKILRKYKLDEVPQLLNVIKGEMSFVGPRPQVPKYVKEYGELKDMILMVRPGITDYASVKYKHESSILSQYKDPEEAYIKYILPVKLQLNLKYIEEMSIIIDLKLIFITIFNLFRL